MAKTLGKIRSEYVQEALQILGTGKCDIVNCDSCKYELGEAIHLLKKAQGTFTYRRKVRKGLLHF